MRIDTTDLQTEMADVLPNIFEAYISKKLMYFLEDGGFDANASEPLWNEMCEIIEILEKKGKRK